MWSQNGQAPPDYAQGPCYDGNNGVPQDAGVAARQQQTAQIEQQQMQYMLRMQQQQQMRMQEQQQMWMQRQMQQGQGGKGADALLRQQQYWMQYQQQMQQMQQGGKGDDGKDGGGWKGGGKPEWQEYLAKGMMKGGKGMYTDEPDEPEDLRFSVNDRVLCNMGEQWLLGIIVECDFDADGEYYPYGVKLDMGNNRITVPADDDETCRREVCFPEKLWQFSGFATPVFTAKQKAAKLRFDVDTLVAFRVHDTPEGEDKWLTGTVLAHWCQLPNGTAVPYKIRADSSVFTPTVYFCHKDDHTLIRLPENIPQERIKTIAQRMEKRKRPDGQMETFDHSTGRGRLISTA